MFFEHRVGFSRLRPGVPGGERRRTTGSLGFCLMHDNLRAALPEIEVHGAELHALARARVASLEGEQLRWELHFAESKHELDYGDWGGKNCKGEYDTYDDNALLLAARGGYWCGGLHQQSEMVRLLLHAGADMRLSSYPSGIDGDCDTPLSFFFRLLHVFTDLECA